MKYYQNICEAAKAFKEAEAFIFDMDGLIFDTERLFMEQLAVAMAAGGYRLSQEVYKKSLGLNGERLKQLMLKEYGEKYPFAEMGERARECVNVISETVGLPVKENIPELLQWLHEKNIICAVASSTNSLFVNQYLEKAGLRKYFSVIIGGEMVETSKPDPAIFLRACRECHILPAKAVVLEDSENGIRAASAAKIPVICVPDLKLPEKEVCTLISAMVLQNSDEII